MNLKDFKNKKITVFGLGIMGGGVGAARFFSRLGAKVTVTDIKQKEELRESIEKLRKFKIDFVLGEHRKENFINADLVIKGPGIPDNSPYLEIARRNKVKIDTDVGIFFELCQATIIGITGSKGKSTTAALVHQVLRTKFKDTLLGGNIGISVLDILPAAKKGNIVVLELSSWQLEGLLSHKKSPHIAVITNIFPEHLNRYKSFNDYIEAKKTIFKFQEKKDYLILNENLKEISLGARSKTIFFKNGSKEIARIIGEIYNIPPKKIKKAIDGFEGLEGRLEFIEEIGGVKFYNDTCSTHPESTIYSINELKRENPSAEIILIAGGEDKNLNFERFDNFIEKEVKLLILLPGIASEKIKSKVSTIKVENMEEAVREAKNNAKNGDIILLSPAAASFNLFKNEFDRGEDFNKTVKEINKE